MLFFEQVKPLSQNLLLKAFILAALLHAVAFMLIKFKPLALLESSWQFPFIAIEAPAAGTLTADHLQHSLLSGYLSPPAPLAPSISKPEWPQALAGLYSLAPAAQLPEIAALPPTKSFDLPLSLSPAIALQFSENIQPYIQDHDITLSLNQAQEAMAIYQIQLDTQLGQLISFEAIKASGSTELQQAAEYLLKQLKITSEASGSIVSGKVSLNWPGKHPHD